ncbi:MAG: hypothetical protein HY721_06405 [Planctomycetes bacterium]|nr:hypothetical protein [Planctomycetota bacterium]
MSEGRPLLRPEDSNRDGAVDIGDPVFTLNHLFTGGPRPPCLRAADANRSGTVDIADAIATLGYLFGAQTAPVAGIGESVKIPNLACDLGWPVE